MSEVPRPLSDAALPSATSSDARAFVPLFCLFILGWGSNQFAPLLLFYPRIMPLGPVEVQILFVLYGLSLIPMLVVGGWLSDRLGRAGVLTIAVLLCALSSAVLLAGGTGPAAIVCARILTGVGCGIGFSSATAWATELLPAPRGSRLSMILMTSGMGVGPLFIGILASRLLAAHVPGPQIWVMLPHLCLALVALALLVWHRRRLRGAMVTLPVGDAVAEAAPGAVQMSGGTAPGAGPGGSVPGPPTGAVAGALAGAEGQRGLRDGRFWRIVVPLAPWTLLCTGVPLAVLPSAVGGGAGIDPLLFSAFLTPLPALGGLCVQPVAGHAKVSPRVQAPVALAIAACALGLAVLAVRAQSLSLLLVTCFVFGLAHGLCQTAGLRIVAQISQQTRLGRNTAVFQALSYVGFLAPLPIAMLGQYIALSQILMGILLLAVLMCGLLLVAALRGRNVALRP
ncbi:MFS transporter [Brevibacterium sp. 91QC2O2]|uniref:MFS transporter n=1 Tax=Micrococcales TaxID=85006 RepID=UPI00211C7321|nr:MFS transporter [Galactobacter sp.]MCQ9368652.1 MFS transporter [Brevibacterium sp. 91QC2O2]MCQ9386398.1 MFS transporter [Brevibacterium sp. 68QC2CO]